MSVFDDFINYGEYLYLSSVAMLFNGKLIEDYVNGYRTLTVSGRETLGYEFNTSGRILGRDGVIPISKNLPPREITVKYLLTADDNTLFQAKFRELNQLLNTSDDVPIQFRDEMEVTYFGQVTSMDAVDDNTNTVIAEYTIFCSDPYKYEGKRALTGNPLNIYVGTPYKTHPKEIAIQLKSDASKITVDNNTTGRHIILNGDYKIGDNIVINIDNKVITQNNRNIMNNLDYISSDFHEFWLHDGDTIQVTPTNSDLTISFQGRWK